MSTYICRELSLCSQNRVCVEHVANCSAGSSVLCVHFIFTCVVVLPLLLTLFRGNHYSLFFSFLHITQCLVHNLLLLLLFSPLLGYLGTLEHIEPMDTFK